MCDSGVVLTRLRKIHRYNDIQYRIVAWLGNLTHTLGYRSTSIISSQQRDHCLSSRQLCHINYGVVLSSCFVKRYISLGMSSEQCPSLEWPDKHSPFSPLLPPSLGGSWGLELGFGAGCRSVSVMKYICANTVASTDNPGETLIEFLGSPNILGCNC